MKKKVIIVGAGFSGLSLAHECLKRGLEVEVFERFVRAGGMIESPTTPYGFYETAANAFLGNEKVFQFLRENGIEPVLPAKAAKKRYIYRQRPRRWPLPWIASFIFVGYLLRALVLGREWRKPKPNENVESWGRRLFGTVAGKMLLETALLGVYAGDAQKLSAELVLRTLLRKEKGPRRLPMLSGARGMGRLMSDLQRSLERRGVVFHFNQEVNPEILLDPKDHVVIATSAPAAAALLQKVPVPAAQENAKILHRLETLPLISVTSFYNHPPQKFLGFGILFPRSEGIRALGVLMNSIIFERGFTTFTETWIFGGALDPAILQFSDGELKALVMSSSEKVFGTRREMPLEIKITRWPFALPHYTVEWKNLLQEIKSMGCLHLHGNYLGRLGLSGILETSEELAEKLSHQ